MKSPRYARLVAEILRQYEPPARDTPLPRSERDAEIELIEQTMDRQQRRARRRRNLAVIAAAAALIVGTGGAWRVQTGSKPAPLPVAGIDVHAPYEEPPVIVAIASGNGAIVTAPGSSQPAIAGRALTAGSRLIVDPSAGAKLSLSTGTHLDVDPGSQLGVLEDGKTQIFELTAGSLHADVAKLSQDERFLVRTTDAEVEVRGTSFLVEVVDPDLHCGAGTATRVTVSEGVVMVRSHGREDAVRAGESWPHGCRKRAHAAPTAVPRNVNGHPHNAGSATATPPAPSPIPQPELLAAPAPVGPTMSAHASSRLAEENNLFAEAMLARRNGQLRLALDKMERVLERFPTGHLAENAAAERMRLLRAVDPARAPLAAMHYLKLYPTGFARSDAEAILAASR